MRRRFFVERFEGQTAIIDGETAHHLGRVLRAQQGQLYELSDGAKVWLARIESVSRDRIGFALLEEIPWHQLTTDLTLLLSVVKFDAFEWALEKATELGVSRIIPLAAARSEKGLLAAAAKRSERWKKVLIESSQQSRRISVPALDKLTQPDDAFANHPDAVRLLLSERADTPSLRHIFEAAAKANATKSKKVVLAIGPEGGWTDGELELARQAGFQEASLRRLILRAETAVIAALASINYALGE